MPVCSTTRIVVGGVTLLDFDDVMEGEISSTTSQAVQADLLIRSRPGSVVGRKNYITDISWSRYYFFDPETATLGQPEDAIDAARIFQLYHPIPAVTWPAQFATDFPALDISVPDGTNAAVFSYNYGWDSGTTTYASAALTNVNIEIPQPCRVLVNYGMTMTGGAVT